jgi:hypothetical protein
LKPGQVITAEIRRGAEANVIVRFEVQDRDHRGFINYEGFKFSNMQPRPEIHEFFSMIDTRIPPYAEYIDVDDRPYPESGTINFNLQDGILVSDLSSNSPAAEGGDNGHGINLPPIIPVQEPVAPIDLSAGTKVPCASPAPVADESDSESTESEDDTMFRITQAIHRGEPVQVALNGYFKGYQNIDSVVQFRQPYSGGIPDSLRSLFNFALAQIAVLPLSFGSEGFPNSLYWATVTFTSAQIDTVLSKSDNGLLVSFHRHDMPGMAIREFPATYTLKLPSGLRDFTLTQYLANITAPRSENPKPWLVLLIAQPWRDSETGEIWLNASPTHPQDVDPTATNPVIPRNAAQSPCFTSTTRRKEIERLLKFGRDSNWPLSISVASSLDGLNSATVTCPSPWTDCDS